MITYIKKHPFISCFCIHLFILIAYLISGTMKYEVSDDFMMQMMVSNAYGSSSSDMMFTSPILAILLSTFYQILPMINWYFYFQTFLIMISLTIISYVFIKENKSSIIQVLLTILLFICRFLSPP